MKQSNMDNQQNGPASLPEREIRREHIGRQYPNKIQFEEAVQKLREEFEKHPEPPKGIFY